MLIQILVETPKQAALLMYRCINLFKYSLKEAIDIEKYSCWEGLEANRHCYAPENMLKMVINAKDVK